MATTLPQDGSFFNNDEIEEVILRVNEIRAARGEADLDAVVIETVIRGLFTADAFNAAPLENIACYLAGRQSLPPSERNALCGTIIRFA